MTNKDLAIIESVKGTSLEVYQDRDEVRELAHRLLSLHPEAKTVGSAGMTAVAQLALMVGASPLPGTNEIHVWYNKKRDIVQFALGINFYRRKSEERGSVLWQTQPRQMREDEREQYGVAPGMIAAICTAVRAPDMMKYMKMGLKANQIFDMAGRTGMAIANPATDGKVGRTAVWTCLKRAEIDLYRALFPAMMQEVADKTQEVETVAITPEPLDLSENDFDDLFGYGDSPTADLSGPNWGESEIITEDGEIIEVDESDYDWQKQAQAAASRDALYQALYELHKPSGVFEDSNEVKRGVEFMCGKWDESANGRITEAIKRYVDAVADGATKKDTAKSVKEWYAPDSEQPALFDDEAPQDGAFE